MDLLPGYLTAHVAVSASKHAGPYSRTAYLDKIRQGTPQVVLPQTACRYIDIPSRDAGLRVLRIFISATEANYKYSGSEAGVFWPHGGLIEEP